MAQAAIGRISSKKLGPWKGMNEKVSPAELPPGVLANIQNALLDEVPGLVVKRQGTRLLTVLPSGLPPRDTHVFTKLDGTSYLLISDGVSLYYTTDPTGAYPAAIKTGLNTDGYMQFETAENKVWMTNGINPVMSWDGTTLLTYDRTYTSTTNLTTVDSTHIIHAGLTEADDYWNGMKLVFTVGANIGTVVTVTDFVAATDTLTFTPAVAGIAATDRFVLGVVIPKGAATRYYDGHLFMGCTADNQAELRFSEISDPDTGEVMTIDNPRAWPAANELALNVLDQEKLQGITPILRDRIMVMKATGLYRLERDPLVIYRLELVSGSVGSRFPDTWAEKNNLLYFLGQDNDSLPDVYKTDMVDVSLVDPDGGIEPTLRGLQQPNSVQNSRTFTSTADFDAGEKSTLADTADGQLGVGAFDSETKWQDNLVSGSNVDIETTPSTPTLLGNPVWEVNYAGTEKPSSSVPPWSYDNLPNPGTTTQSGNVSSGGALVFTNGPVFPGGEYYFRRDQLVSTKDSLAVFRCKGSSSSFFFGLRNGAYAVQFAYAGSVLTRYGAGTSALIELVDDTYYIFTVLLKSNGTFKLWIDGALVDSASAFASAAPSEIRFGMGGQNTAVSTGEAVSVGNTCSFDYVKYHTDYKGDQLQSFNGKISPLTLPSTLPLSGTLIVVNDLGRTPDAMRRLYQVSTLNGGTVGLESWTAGVVAFTSDTDPAGYVAVANGAIPTSLAKRAQRIRVTLTRADAGNAPELTNLYSGMLWVSPSVQLGSNIAAWRTLLTTIVTPAGTAQTIWIRRATVTTTPVEGDFGAWFAIVNGDNIGTILTDAVPTSRWAQLKVEQGVSSAGLLPYVDAVVAQWTDGSVGNLPVRAIVHKKRYMISAATALVTANDIVVVCDRNDQWTKFTGLSLNAMVHFKSVLYGANAANAGMSEMDIADVYNDYGAAIDAFIETREEDFGVPHLRKDLRYSYLHWSRADAAWTLLTTYRRNGDLVYTGSASHSFGLAGLDIRQNFPVATVGRGIQRKYRNATLDHNMQFAGETIYFGTRGPQP